MHSSSLSSDDGGDDFTEGEIKPRSTSNTVFEEASVPRPAAFSKQLNQVDVIQSSSHRPAKTTSPRGFKKAKSSYRGPVLDIESIYFEKPELVIGRVKKQSEINA